MGAAAPAAPRVRVGAAHLRRQFPAREPLGPARPRHLPGGVAEPVDTGLVAGSRPPGERTGCRLRHKTPLPGCASTASPVPPPWPPCTWPGARHCSAPPRTRPSTRSIGRTSSSTPSPTTRAPSTGWSPTTTNCCWRCGTPPRFRRTRKPAIAPSASTCRRWGAPMPWSGTTPRSRSCWRRRCAWRPRTGCCAPWRCATTRPGSRAGCGPATRPRRGATWRPPAGWTAPVPRRTGWPRCCTCTPTTGSVLCGNCGRRYKRHRKTWRCARPCSACCGRAAPWDEAVRHLQAVLAVASDSVFAHRNLGLYLARRRGDAGAALPHLEHAHARTPRDAELIGALAWARHETGDRAGARAVVRAGGRYFRGRPELAAERARILDR